MTDPLSGGQISGISRFRAFAAVLTALALTATLCAYAGLRVGQRPEFNQICCGMPRKHNIVISIEESLGLVRFPSQIGQDRWVSEVVFPGVRNGYFLDVGSGDAAPLRLVDCASTRGKTPASVECGYSTFAISPI